MSRSTTSNSRISSRRNPSEDEIITSISRNLSRNLSRNMSRRRPFESEISSPSPASPALDSHSPAASPTTVQSPHTSRTLETAEPTTPLSRCTRRRSNTPIVFSQSTVRKKPPPVEKKLEFTLEDLCHGCVKKIKITRDVFNHVGYACMIIVQEEETLKITVQPGWRKGTEITFEGKGDEKPGYLPAYIIFLIDEKRHPLFKRAGRDNLEIAMEIPLVDALGGCSFPVPLLGGAKMSLSVDNVIHHGYENVIQGQGMPKLKEPTKRGDLRITCLVNFPTDLSHEQRAESVRILQDCSYH